MAPLAVWMFITPWAMREADEAARSVLVSTLGSAPNALPRPPPVIAFPRCAANRSPCTVALHLQGLSQGLKTPVPWTQEKMVALQDVVRCSQGRAGVHLVWQHHMDKVAVPAGWPHAVCNLSPNAKFAMDAPWRTSLPPMWRATAWCGTGCRPQQRTMAARRRACFACWLQPGCNIGHTARPAQELCQAVTQQRPEQQDARPASTSRPVSGA